MAIVTSIESVPDTTELGHATVGLIQDITKVVEEMVKEAVDMLSVGNAYLNSKSKL